jgi:hypothetical protein
MAQSAVLADGLIKLDRNGTTLLGINTGIPANSPSLRKLAGQRRQSGWIARNGSLETWTPAGFVEHEGRVHVYGPLFEGRTFDELINDESSNRIESVARVADALAALEANEIVPPAFHTRGFVVADDGAVLVLPPDILGAIRDHQDYAERIARMERFIHPDRSNAENASFAIAASTYYVLTGTFPYTGTDEEELHARTRAADPLPANMRVIGIRDDISQTLQEQLAPQDDKPPLPPSDWASLLRTWQKEGTTRALTDEEREAAEQQAQQRNERIERSFRRREGMRRNGRKALIIAAIVIIVGSVPATIIRNALAPRATAGLPPAEVVTVFYTSINSLDHMTMEDAVIDNAAVELTREVTNLFVLDRQRMSVEMESGFVDAAAWRDAGMPTLSNGRVPYGVYGLELETLPAPDGEVWFRASYERWVPDYDNAEITGRTGILGLDNVDIVRLRQDRREDWVIYEREVVSSDPIDLDALREAEG